MTFCAFTDRIEGSARAVAASAETAETAATFFRAFVLEVMMRLISSKPNWSKTGQISPEIMPGAPHVAIAIQQQTDPCVHR